MAWLELGGNYETTDKALQQAEIKKSSVKGRQELFQNVMDNFHYKNRDYFADKPDLKDTVNQTLDTSLPDAAKLPKGGNMDIALMQALAVKCIQSLVLNQKTRQVADILSRQYVKAKKPVDGLMGPNTLYLFNAIRKLKHPDMSLPAKIPEEFVTDMVAICEGNTQALGAPKEEKILTAPTVTTSEVDVAADSVSRVTPRAIDMTFPTPAPLKQAPVDPRQLPVTPVVDPVLVEDDLPELTPRTSPVVLPTDAGKVDVDKRKLPVSPVAAPVEKAPEVSPVEGESLEELAKKQTRTKSEVFKLQTLLQPRYQDQKGAIDGVMNPATQQALENYKKNLNQEKTPPVPETLPELTPRITPIEPLPPEPIEPKQSPIDTRPLPINPVLLPEPVENSATPPAAPIAKKQPKEALRDVVLDAIATEKFSAAEALIKTGNYEQWLTNPYIISTISYSQKFFDAGVFDTVPTRLLAKIRGLLPAEKRAAFIKFLDQKVGTQVNDKLSLPLVNGKIPDGVNHANAVDIFDKEGTPIKAMAGGIVVLSEDTRKPGQELSTSSYNGWNTIVIYNPVKKTFYRYAHLEKVSVKAGDILQSWDAIGTVGHTWKSASQPGHGQHLHLEIHPVRVDGSTVGSIPINDLRQNINALNQTPQLAARPTPVAPESTVENMRTLSPVEWKGDAASLESLVTAAALDPAYKDSIIKVQGREPGKTFYSKLLDKTSVSQSKEGGYILFHGSAIDDKSLLQVWMRSANFAYAVFKNGAIVQFFDDNAWRWAAGDNAKLNGDDQVNQKGIGIEFSLPMATKDEVVDPNQAQLSSWRALRNYLAHKHGIPESHVTTSAQVVTKDDGTMTPLAHTDTHTRPQKPHILEGLGIDPDEFNRRTREKRPEVAATE